jgi:hypothetical protein
LVDRVTWRGYESESEVLWRALASNRPVSSIEIPTIYIDGNRGSQFHAWRDSARIAALFTTQIRWTVSMALLDFALFGTAVGTGLLSPVRANLGARATAVLCQAALRPDYRALTRRLVQREGPAQCLLAFGAHLTVTTALVGAFVSCGAPPIAGKAAAQLLGYLGSFAVIDRVMLNRVFRARSPGAL